MNPKRNALPAMNQSLDDHQRTPEQTQSGAKEKTRRNFKNGKNKHGMGYKTEKSSSEFHSFSESHKTEIRRD